MSGFECHLNAGHERLRNKERTSWHEMAGARKIMVKDGYFNPG
jgi:hypothetical protein